jgi:hypothetical protein
MPSDVRRSKVSQVDTIRVDVVAKGLTTGIRERKRSALYLYRDRLHLAGQVTACIADADDVDSAVP